MQQSGIPHTKMFGLHTEADAQTKQVQGGSYSYITYICSRSQCGLELRLLLPHEGTHCNEAMRQQRQEAVDLRQAVCAAAGLQHGQQWCLSHAVLLDIYCRGFSWYSVTSMRHAWYSAACVRHAQHRCQRADLWLHLAAALWALSGWLWQWLCAASDHRRGAPPAPPPGCGTPGGRFG